MTIDTAAPVLGTIGATRTRRLLCIVFGVALLLRVLVVCWLNFIPKQYQPFMPIFANDALTYDSLAKSLIAGLGYQWGGDPLEITSIPPLFPCWLSLLYRLGLSSVAAVGFVNALLGALTAVVLFLLIREAFSPRLPQDERVAAEAMRRAEWVALAASLIFAVYPFELFNTPFVLKENFSILLTSCFVWGWVRLWGVRATMESWKWALFTGVFLGLSVLSRYPHQGLAVAFLCFNLYWLWKLRKIGQSPCGIRRGTAIVLVIFLLTLSPWLIRNYEVFGEITLSSNGPAHALFNANSPLSEPETNGYFEGHGQKRIEFNQQLSRETRGNPQLRESIYRREVTRGVLSHPRKVLQLMAAKLVSMWRPVWAGSSLRSWVMLGVPYLVLMVLALPGLVLAYRHRTDFSISLSMLYAVVLFYVLGHLIFYGMIRERQYVEPYLMAFAAYTLWLWFGAGREVRSPVETSDMSAGTVSS